MTNAAGWTLAELNELTRLTNSNLGFDRMRAALSAIGAVRQAPDEPSDATIEAMCIADFDARNADKFQSFSDAYKQTLRTGMRAAYKAARLTLAAPVVGERGDDAQAAHPAPTAEDARLREALKEILKGYGAYDKNPLNHASNTIDSMKAIARAALAADTKEPA